jgi:hypothetical protein
MTRYARTAAILPALFLSVPFRGLPAEKLVDPVTLADDHVSRGEPIRVLLKDGPTTRQPAQLMLERNGEEEALPAVYAPASGQASGMITADVKKAATFGTYAVRPVLDGRKLPSALRLVIGPPGGGAVTLAKFDPAETYGTEPFFVPGSEEGDKPRRLETVRLVLRGKGFLQSGPQDNAIWINGVRQDKIVWDHACSDPASAGTANAPKPNAIHGEVPSPEELHLCYVPVPANGQLLLAAGFGDSASEPQLFRIFNLTWARVALLSLAIALVLALLPLLLLRFVRKSDRIAGSNYRLRMLFLDPETDTYSLSKLQFYAWTVAALFGYTYLFISRVHVQFGSWPDVPASLPGIILVAAGTAVGSQIVTSAKGPKGAGEESPSFADFITSGGVVAPDRLQMLLWTILGVSAFFFAVLQLEPGTITDLPAVPERLLVLMGISSAGYLGGKMARKPGPVINELSVTPPESDEAIRDQSAPPQVLPDLLEPVLRAQGALGCLAPGANPDVAAAVGALKKAVDAAASAHTVSEFNQLLADLGAFRDSAEAAAARAASDFLAGKASADDARSAQAAAAALQDLAAEVTGAISVAAAAPIAAEETPPLIARTIELRGANLSPDGLLEIDDADLVFRMLLNSEGKNAPDILARDEVNPTFARVLRLHIDPARLPGVYREQVQKWFREGGSHMFTLLNPDGQRAAVSFTVPPETAQKTGTSS